MAERKQDTERAFHDAAFADRLTQAVALAGMKIGERRALVAALAAVTKYACEVAPRAEVAEILRLTADRIERERDAPPPTAN